MFLIAPQNVATTSPQGKARSRMRFSLPLLTALLALVALVLSAPTHAHAQILPEGSGSFDVSVLTNVLPTTDPDAALGEVAVRAIDQDGATLEGVQVNVSIVPPNSNNQPMGPVASGTTGAAGRVVLQQVVQKATYCVEASKPGYQVTTLNFACKGAENEVWEVTLVPVPQDEPSNPAGPGDSSNPNSPAGFGGLGGAYGAGSVVTSGASDASDSSAAPSFQSLWTTALAQHSWALLVLCLVIAALTAGLLVFVVRKQKQEQEQQQ